MDWGWDPASVEAVATCAAAALAGAAVVFASLAARAQRRTSERLVAIEAARDLPRLVILPPVLLSGTFLTVRVRNDGATMAGPVFVALLDEQGRQPDVTRRALHLAPGAIEKAHLTRSGGTWVVDSEALPTDDDLIGLGQPVLVPPGLRIRAWEASPREAQVQTRYPPRPARPA